MATAKAIVDYAISQIGTAENPLGSNKQKYGALLDTLPWYLYKDGSKTWIHKVNGFDWCTQFVDASFITVFGIDEARKILYRPQYNNYGCVVKYAYNYFKAAGRGYTKADHDPAPGDVIYFQNSDGLSHTGIVIEVTDTSVITVEGNTGKGSNYVAKKTYRKTSDYIYGYGCPVYSDPVPQKYPDPPFKVTCLKSGITGRRADHWSSSKYLGTLDKGTYTIVSVSGDFGQLKEVPGWIYLVDDNLVIERSLDGYTVGKKYKVVPADGLNLRTEPSTKADVIKLMPKGTIVLCRGLKMIDGNTWMQIVDSEGWCAAHYNGDRYVK